MQRVVLYQTLAVLPPSGNVPSPTAVRGGDAFFDAVPKSRMLEVALGAAAVFFTGPIVAATTTYLQGGDGFFDSAPRSRMLEVALGDTFGKPLTPSVQAQGGAGFFDAVAKSRVLEVAMIDTGSWPSLQEPTAASPQGYEWRTTEVYRKRFPVSAQMFAAWQAQGDLVSTPQGWHVAWPERFAKKFPANAQLDSFFTGYQVPTAFVGNAWIVGWDGPPRARFPAGSQIFAAWPSSGDLTSTPQGWPFAWPERIAGKFKASLQLTSGDQWIGNVPTAATPQGWPSIFPERFARKVPAATQQFDLPVLAVYVANIITYPEGWRVVAPETLRRPTVNAGYIEAALQRPFQTPQGWTGFADWTVRRPVKDFGVIAGPVQGAIVSVTPQGWVVTFPERFAKAFPAGLQRFDHFPQYQVATAATPQGWATVETTPRRAGKPQGAEFSAVPARASLWGWVVAFDAPKAVGRPRQAPDAFARLPDATPTGWNVESGLPINSARPILSRGVTWPLDRPTANLTVYPEGWRVEFSHAFRRQVAMQFETFRYGKHDVTIIGRPPLNAGNQAPTLKGIDAAPLAEATLSDPTLKGIDAAPLAEATLSDPTLKGKV